MAKIAKFLIVFVAIASVLSSCAYKRYYKTASKYEESGMYEQAVDYYLSSLEKRESFADSRIGLNRTAVRYAHLLEEKIQRLYLQKDDNGVVEKYKTLQELQKNAREFQVDILISDAITEQFNEAQNRYVSEHYAAGIRYLEQENFNDALAEFNSVAKVNANYENVAKLQELCRCAIIYNDAQTLIASEKNRAAYNKLQELAKINPNFRDLPSLLKRTLARATFNVAFSNFKYAEKSYKNVVEEILTKTKNNIASARHKFNHLVDENQTQKLLNEQKIAMANGLELESNIVPVKAHLVCNLTLISYNVSDRKKTEKRGYIVQNEQGKDPVYHKVIYYEYEQSMTAKMRLEYSLISTETGIVLRTGVLQPKVSDSVHYAVYSGNKKGTLKAGYWESQRKSSENDQIAGTLAQVALKTLLIARQTVKNYEKSVSEMVPEISSTLSKLVLDYNPEEN